MDFSDGVRKQQMKAYFVKTTTVLWQPSSSVNGWWDAGHWRQSRACLKPSQLKIDNLPKLKEWRLLTIHAFDLQQALCCVWTVTTLTLRGMRLAKEQMNVKGLRASAVFDCGEKKVTSNSARYLPFKQCTRSNISDSFRHYHDKHSRQLCLKSRQW